MRKIHHEKKYFLIVIIKSNEKPLTFCKHMLCHVLNVTLYFNYEELMERHKNRFFVVVFFLVFSKVLVQFRIKRKKKNHLVEVIRRPFLFMARRIYTDQSCTDSVCAASGILMFWLRKSKGSKYMCVFYNT